MFFHIMQGLLYDTKNSRLPIGIHAYFFANHTQLRFYADWVNADRYLPPSAISNSVALALLEAGPTSAERLSLRGVPVPARKERR